MTMASIKATDRNQLVFLAEDSAEPRLLLDCSRPLENRSALPLFPARNDPRPSLLRVAAGCMEACRQDPACSAHPLGYSLLLCLLADRLRQVGGPAQVLEYGCGNGALSPHLAGLLSDFHRGSVLCCLTDAPAPRWAERMARWPQARQLQSPYGHSGLTAGRFHAAILNGSRLLPDPEPILAEAMELLTDDGVLLCLSSDPLTAQLLELRFERLEIFDLEEGWQVTAAQRARLRRPLPTPGTRTARLDDLLAQVRSGPVPRSDAAQAHVLDRQLVRAIGEAVALDDRRRKQQLLDLREELLNKLL